MGDILIVNLSPWRFLGIEKTQRLPSIEDLFGDVFLSVGDNAPEPRRMG
jgi:hypothetical protein